MSPVCLWAAVLLVALERSGPAGTAGVEKYLPEETDMVLSANVRQVVAAPVFRRHALDRVRAWLKNDPRAHVLSIVGLDPLRDIDRVVLSGPASFALRTRWLAIIEGRFEVRRIHASAEVLARVEPSRLRLGRQDGVALYQVYGKKLPTPVFAAFLDHHTLVVSPVRGWVTDAIDKHVGKKTPSLNKDLQALLEDRDDRRSLWLAGVPLDLVRHQLADNPRLRAIFSGVRSFGGEIHLTERAQAQLRIDTENPRAALQLRRFLEGARAVTILALTSNEKWARDAPLLAGLLESFRTSQDSGTLTLDASVTGEQIDQWARAKRPPALPKDELPANPPPPGR